MKTKIKELSMKTANEIADQFSPGFFDDRMVSDVAAIIEKHHKELAELIVRECAEVATTLHYPHINNERDEYEERFSKCLKEHFGVKE